MPTIDLNQDVTYRGFLLNDSAIRDSIVPGGGNASGIAGCVLDTASIDDVDVVQFREKRSKADGMDVGEVFLGGRRVRLAGTLYDVSRAAMGDRMQFLRATMAPVLAFRDDPAAKGFRPFYFSTPTLDVTNYPSDAVDGASKVNKRMLLMPQAFSSPEDRDQGGGGEQDALAQQWSAVLYQRRPLIQSHYPQQVLFNTSDTTVTGNLINRGDYYAPLVMVFEVTADSNGTITVQAGDSNFVITIPTSTNIRIVTVDAEEKTLMVEEDSVEALRMDLIAFTGQATWPLVPPGTSPYTVTFDGVTIAA